MLEVQITQRRTCPIDTVFTINLTESVLRLNLQLHDEKLEANHLNYGIAIVNFKMVL
jgi:hypothetical protein